MILNFGATKIIRIPRTVRKTVGFLIKSSLNYWIKVYFEFIMKRPTMAGFRHHNEKAFGKPKHLDRRQFLKNATHVVSWTRHQLHT